jgi:secondary thiamine-phosphate synthase enzyme
VFIDITQRVKNAVKDSNIQDGLCVVYVPHTTAAVTINENADPSVIADIQNHLCKLVPFSKEYRHIEGNSDAHIKASIIGPSETIPIADGNLVLGTWQAIFFCEFDGPRSRDLYIDIK